MTGAPHRRARCGRGIFYCQNRRALAILLMSDSLAVGMLDASALLHVGKLLVFDV